MIYLVIGTSNSGKSVLAEELSMKTDDPYRVYLATMKIYDDAGKERVEKHRRQREGKGFVTIEKEYGIAETLAQIPDPQKTTVLLECVSNLAGNEMFENPEGKNLTTIELIDKVVDEIKQLSKKVNNIIIVTNEYERDDEGYDVSTRRYVYILSMINEKLSAFSEKIYDLRKGN
ncbi:MULTISPECIES: bifunctional adenosylcobinamide kinase/adenosylcobinamide-phosphate guanylyltransferase [unclassified Butyrivibrio]|uniref:bifunctional adenosylcobinamide kinase/adenosylcobinamide-phosphate guanylyltransferase n=1 Tax=unclassified Butyrivibrio TaxID=2639466 RepID=UPI000424A070|nr:MULTISPECIES: bifunctional adenosylcobinamide kinase/adenosylcobinamide-phosphate guanylyltransferase [unclassified Butyrivibrio]